MDWDDYSGRPTGRSRCQLWKRTGSDVIQKEETHHFLSAVRRVLRNSPTFFTSGESVHGVDMQGWRLLSSHAGSTLFSFSVHVIYEHEHQVGS